MMSSTAVKLMLLLFLPILVTTWRFRRKYKCNHLHFSISISVPKMLPSKIATVRLFPRSNHKLRMSIVRLHNKYRASVVPSASNMLRMVNTRVLFPW